uniref:Uncharacterized protein n=2 Tax=Caenorhabditis japonica TaxID=281687 RepID=A0A8R1J2V9_CAEJA
MPSRNGHALRAEERTPLTTYQQIDENANDDQSQSLSQRQQRNWFICDSSQLPREPTCPTSLMDSYQMTPGSGAPNSTPNPTDDLEQKEESPILTQRKEEKQPSNPNSDSVFPPTKDFSDYIDEQYHKSRASSNSPKSPQEDLWDETPESRYVPPVVLLQSETPDLPWTIENHGKTEI